MRWQTYPNMLSVAMIILVSTLLGLVKYLGFDYLAVLSMAPFYLLEPLVVSLFTFHQIEKFAQGLIRFMCLVKHFFFRVALSSLPENSTTISIPETMEDTTKVKSASGTSSGKLKKSKILTEAERLSKIKIHKEAVHKAADNFDEGYPGVITNERYADYLEKRTQFIHSRGLITLPDPESERKPRPNRLNRVTA